METTVRFHKADVIYHGRFIMASKRCHSWRPEANHRHDGDIVGSVYFGMGAQESTGLTHDLVLFTRRLSVLRAVVDVLQDIGVNRYRGDVTQESLEQARAMAMSIEDSYADAHSTASEVLHPAVPRESPIHLDEDDFEEA